MGVSKETEIGKSVACASTAGDRVVVHAVIDVYEVIGQMVDLNFIENNHCCSWPKAYKKEMPKPVILSRWYICYCNALATTAL